MEQGLPDAASAERYLAELEPFGLRLGLERMRLLCEELGEPQRSYATLHIVGTNGKTSVARMVEGLLADAGLRAGASLSPHLYHWRERINIAGRSLAETDFAAAADRVRTAVSDLEASGRLAPGERMTQFEVATAIAFHALAEAQVDVAAVEAGLGGRLDASNVIDSSLTVLTTVGLDHVEWLGESEVEIAAEKLAVLRPGTALLLGPVSDPVREVARRHAAEQNARLIEVDTAPATGLVGGFRRLDLEIARTAAAFVLDNLGYAQAAARLRDDPAHVTRVAAEIRIPGRMELIDGDPPLLLDVAHNPQGAVALAEALPEVTAGRPVVACLAALADKDVDGIAAALAPALDYAVCTEFPKHILAGSGRPGAHAHPATRLGEAFRGQDLMVTVQTDPQSAIELTQEKARDLGAIALVTGSHHLVAMARDRRLCDH